MRETPQRPAQAVYVYADLAALSHAAAEAVVSTGHAAVARSGRFRVVLAGGDTPRVLYRLLASDYQGRFPSSQADVFWGDERYVGPADTRSNYGMAKQVLLDHLPIPPENIHPMPTHFPDPEEAARAYERVLEQHFPSGWPRFDLVLLGLAANGHVASLFPRSPALNVTDRKVMAVRVEADPPLRLTLTLPAINHASVVYFLVAGEAKAEALRRALAADADPKTSPAASVRPVDGHVAWWVDEAAASRGRPML